MKRCIRCSGVYASSKMTAAGKFDLCENCAEEWMNRNRCVDCDAELTEINWSIYHNKKSPGGIAIRPRCKDCQTRQNRQLEQDREREIRIISKTFNSICDYIRSHGYAPTVMEIAADLKLSDATIRRHLWKLEKRGFIRRSRQWRGIEIVKHETAQNAA